MSPNIPKVFKCNINVKHIKTYQNAGETETLQLSLYIIVECMH